MRFDSKPTATILRLITAILSLFLLTGLCSCSDNSSLDIALALGAGRVIDENQSHDDTSSPTPVIPKNGIVVCIDPGHGYDDGGTSSEFLGTLLEKDITLSVSMKFKDHLESLGFDVIMTHDGTSIPSTSADDGNNKFNPMERVAFANALGTNIDCYISLHCNSYDTSDVSGTRVYYYEGADKVSTGLDIATVICDQVQEDFPDNAVPTCENYPYYVVKYTTVPAVLIEMGFVTNESDAADLIDPQWQDDFAESLANAIDKYYKANSDNNT